MAMQGTLFIISGPSGVGKTTLVKAVIEQLASLYSVRCGITYTSRAPRPLECHGRDYYFITEQEFEAKIKGNFFIEWSRAYGAYYGSSRDDLDTLEPDTGLILILDRSGALAVKHRAPHAFLIWITVSDTVLLAQRLMHRAANSSEDVEKRLKIAQKEIEDEEKYHRYDCCIINDVFADAQRDLASFILSKMGPKKG